MKTIKSLLLLWQDKESTLYFHVGTLNYNGEKYVFEYTHHSNDTKRKVHDAMKHGYRPHPAFPLIEKKYESEYLFPAFDRRVPSSDRVDYQEILDDFNLPLEADRMDMLRKTRGTLSGDPYSFEEPLRLDNENNLESHFYISGMRHRNLPEDWPSIVRNDKNLIAVPEEYNKYDPYAVQIKTQSDLFLGYVPGVYAQAVKALINRGIDVILTVNETRPTYAPQWWVRVNLSASLNVNDGEKNMTEVKELVGLVFRAA